MRRLFCALLALALCASALFACAAEAAGEADVLLHNYILIIDNSRSTTGRHSLGGATDPKGLRFDAAKLVYENVLSSAENGVRGQIGVIVFCGPENCVSYGPMPIDGDPAALDEAIGKNLNEAANRDRRDNFTDIRTAVQAALEMMRGFEGDTSVILLTDGVNDLTNVSDPFSQPENIEANDRTVETIGQMRGLGADFFVVALTARDAARDADAFMAFINRMAEAGGGSPREDGNCDNVLMATQADLNSKLLQLLIRAESTGEASIQAAAQSVNEAWEFAVPYAGISDATVNITFMPEDKASIRSVELTAPDGAVYTPYADGAAQPAGDIAVTDDRSYIILGIPAPRPGDWSLNVLGAKQVDINTVVRFNHNLKLRAEAPQSVIAGELLPIRVYVQQYVDGQYADLTGSDIYTLAAATLAVSGPGDESPRGYVPMKAEGDGFAVEISMKSPGEWRLAAEVRTDYWSDVIGDMAVEVLPEPTPTPVPDPAAQDGADGSGDGSAAPGGVSVETGEGADAVNWNVQADPATGKMTVSWDGNGAENAVAELCAEGSDAPILSGIHSGDAIDMSALDGEQNYSIMLAAFSDSGDGDGTPPPMQKLDIQVLPDADQIGDAVLSVIGATVQLAPNGLASPEMIENGMRAAKTIEDSVDALSQLATEGGSDAGSAFPDAGSLSAAPGGSAGAAQEASAGSGGRSEDDAPEGGADEAPEGRPTVRPSEPGEIAAPEETVAPAAPAAPTGVAGILDMLKAHWIIVAGAAAALLALIAVIVIVRGAGEKVSGRVKLVCEPIKLEMLLLFEGKGRIKVNSPLTKHPEVAKLGRCKIYDVLSHIQVGMAKADPHGLVAGSEMQHMPEEPLISFSCTDPKSGEQQTVHVGRVDAAESVLKVYDAGRYYDVKICGNLDLTELLALRGRK